MDVVVERCAALDVGKDEGTRWCGRAIMVSGEAGVGKTSLARVLCEIVGQRPGRHRCVIVIGLGHEFS